MTGATLNHIAKAGAAPNPAAAFDIVFVHGLGGDPIDTWTHATGGFWPAWLADRFAEVNVYTAGYESGIFASVLKGEGASLNDRATTLLDLLAARPTAGKPVVFITHSLGGLLVKQVLRLSSSELKPRTRAVSDGVLGVLFIATPHHGAQLASVICSIVATLASYNVKQLTYGHEQLLELAQWFANWAGGRQLYIGSYFELHKYKGALVVDKMSANPHVHGCSPVAIDADHVGITKLANSSAHLFISICACISDLLTALPPPDGDGGDEELLAFRETAADDRRTLAEKLTSVRREGDIAFAERKKEFFSKSLNRHIAHPAAALRYTRLLSDINSRFHRHVRPLLEADAPPVSIQDSVQERVIDPSLEAFNADNGHGTAGLVDGAYYYLAGNCHIGWDK